MERTLDNDSPTFDQPRPHWLTAVHATLLRWQLKRRTRRQLAQLDAHQLADVGIGPGERLAELDKPFWR